MKRQFSISTRLTFWFSTVFLIGFLIFGACVYGTLAYTLAAGRDKTLSGRAKRLRELLEKTRADSAERRSTKFGDFREATPEGHLIQAFDAQGARVFPPATGPSVDFPWPNSAKSASERILTTTWYAGKLYRILGETTPGENHFRLMVAGQLEDNRVILNHMATALLWTTPGLLCMSALFGHFLSRRVLTPVARLTASARSIAIGNLQDRLPISNTGDELAQLAETCNGMLARVENAVNQITRFTADASHELRSPIAYIRTLSEYALRRPDLDHDTADSFREIVQETESATRLLEDMLTLARADAGNARLNFEPVDIAMIVFETFRRAQPLAEAKFHEFALDSNATESVRFTGDRSSLQRLLWNLVDNAIRYTPEGGRVLLRLHVNGKEARVLVQDSGLGIPEPALAHIFDRFYRVEQDRQMEEGTGLGLAIAKWIADIHQVALSVRSTMGEGCMFEAVFPLVHSGDKPMGGFASASGAPLPHTAAKR